MTTDSPFQSMTPEQLEHWFREVRPVLVRMQEESTARARRHALEMIRRPVRLRGAAALADEPAERTRPEGVQVITLPDALDVQVASGFPAVNVYRIALRTAAAQRAAVRRAADHRDWALANYLTTTAAGREGRAQAVERVDLRCRELAVMEARLPGLGEAAREEAPAAAERVLLSVEAYRARLLGEQELYGR